MGRASHSTIMNISSDVVLFGDDNEATQVMSDLISTRFSLSFLDIFNKYSISNLNKKTSVICVSKLESKELSLISNILNVSNNESIIILNASDTRNVERAKELNVSYVFTPPLDREAILLAIRRSINKIVEAAWKDLKPAEEKALRQSVTSFDSCFDAAARGKRLPVSEVFSACESIQESMGVSNVDRWLGALRHHHDCTYRHSMYVCGALAFFAHAHGLRGQELKELTVGGFLHDAGKAQIPLGILDNTNGTRF